MSFILTFISIFSFLSLTSINVNDVYTVKSPEIIVSILTSPFLAPVISGLLLVPVLPEAIVKYKLSLYTLDDVKYISYVFVFYGRQNYYRHSLVRHYIIGLYLFYIYVPIALLVTNFIKYYNTVEKNIFLATYIASLSLISIPLCSIGFLIDENYSKINHTPITSSSYWLQNYIVRLKNATFS